MFFAIGHFAGGVVTAVYAAEWASTNMANSVVAAMAVSSVSLTLDWI